MTEGFRSPPQSPTGPGYVGAAAARQDAVDTVQRIMGEDIAPAQRPATPPTAAIQGGPPPDDTDPWGIGSGNANVESDADSDEQEAR